MSDKSDRLYVCSRASFECRERNCKCSVPHIFDDNICSDISRRCESIGSLVHCEKTDYPKFFDKANNCPFLTGEWEGSEGRHIRLGPTRDRFLYRRDNAVLIHCSNSSNPCMTEGNCTEKDCPLDTNLIHPDDYRTLYRTIETWGQMDELNAKLNFEQVDVLLGALEVVKDYTGLDMRQEYLMACLRSELKIRYIKKERENDKLDK